MNEREEGRFERSLWTVIGYVAFGSIALPLCLAILGAIFGSGGGKAFHATAPIFAFGMTMVGALAFGFALNDSLKGKTDWIWLAISGAWLFFFGRTFLRIVGIDV